MEISRRDFLRYIGASAAAFGLSSLDLGNIEKALASSSSPPVIWLSGSSCTGCSVSLLNAVNPTIDQVLLNNISLKYHPQLMAAAGDVAVAAARSTATAGGHVLVVEGSIPTASGGKYCYVWDEGGKSVTMASAVSSLAANAKAILAVGTCASFGGVCGANPVTGSKSLGSYLGKPVINIPGCPAHPSWIVGTIVTLLSGKTPALDSNRRPTQYFTSQVIHKRCPRRERDEAKNFGQDGRCLKEIGCQGPRTHANCDTLKWNNGQSWCIAVNGPCIACVEPNFPSFPLHRNIDD